jgi:hypothetical protein
MRQDDCSDKKESWIDKIQKWRSKRAIARDAATDAKTIYSRHDPKGRKQWAKNPGRSDLKGVDTKNIMRERQETLLLPPELPPLRGHAKLVHLNAERSKRARTMDGRQTARHLFRKPTDENIQEWADHPGRRDFLRIDSKGRHAGSEQAGKTQPKERETPQTLRKYKAKLETGKNVDTQEQSPSIQGIPKKEETITLDKQVYEAIKAAGMAGYREVGGGIYLRKDLGSHWTDGKRPGQVLTLKANDAAGAHVDLKAPILFHTHHRDIYDKRTQVTGDYLPRLNGRDVKEIDLKQEVKDTIWDDLPSAGDINTMKHSYAAKKAMLIFTPKKVITLRNRTRTPGLETVSDTDIYAAQTSAVYLSNIESSTTIREARKRQKFLSKDLEERIQLLAGKIGVEVDFAHKKSPRVRFIKRG